MRKLWLIFSQVATVALAAWFVLATFQPRWLHQLQAWGRGEWHHASVTIKEVAPSSGSSVGKHPGFSVAAKRASPAVVSIVTSRATNRNPRLNDPWFRFFFGEQGSRTQVGMGSGVIVSPEGYVLTNNHVVDQVDDIEVLLVDGRKAKAKVVGTDPDSDLAVLKIDLNKLPVITFGDSEHIAVGDEVLAIGNPFGVGQTVTSGIVSALGRNQLGINTFENFIQTDAAINPGNSGGALVDTDGNLLGINTAIYSRSGGNMGIGFAIPAATAKQVMESLIRDGHVTRGWIGVEPRDLVPDMAQALNVQAQEGVLITAVLQGGPANKAGIKPGDVITGVGDRSISDTQELLSTVAALKPRTEVPVRVERGRQQLTLKVVVAERPRVTPGEEQQNADQGDDQGDGPDGDQGGDQGDDGSADGGSSGPQ